MNEKFYQLKITLIDSQPAIWRQFVVPASIPLDRLHDAIQIVMGWQDSHLHEFRIGKQRLTEMPEEPSDGEEEGLYRLIDLVKQKGRTFSYVYDFGDNWEHEIILENSNYPEQDLPLPIYCLDGARACPLEDTGGVYGYENLIAILNDPSHEEYEETRQWVNGLLDLAENDHFDPELFCPNSINGFLALYYRWSRDRHQPLWN
ncbi:Plasmid pRiA4b ORF-3-like protein [Photorhabdus australis subsp. thailandensis]|uniref:Plasmid pRiA4b ORF-3-like protein n=1 Tax=Photorhabdus australis subsp. thailandensis TaxID=2805096 RepID=A0A1C0U7A7_9GAMM|nr:plasmid pRiA4b ORF-3 family protein [Photorhabdus australis]OCQ53808.1 Plasmid pRiA4b ORF-3-like protein [Photorhabdus australis subsp. thailandensis]